MNDKKAYRIILVNLALFMLFGALNAQISTMYSFGQATALWQPIWGLYATDAMVDEGLSTPVNIGFTFPYAGSEYTQVKISSNGWVNLGTNLNSTYYVNGLATLNIRPLLAPLWDDLDMSVGAVQYGVEGVTPHRLFIVQWLAAKWNANGANEFNFMVRMHETGQVDFIYGPHTGTPNNPSASIGINMAPGGSGYFYSVIPGFPAHVSTNNDVSNITNVASNGLLYFFSPKTINAQDGAAINLTGNAAPMQNVSTELQAIFGNAGTAFTQTDAYTGYLMSGEQVLATVNVPSIQPGGYVSIPIAWVPDSVGTKPLYIKASLQDDSNSDNDKSYPFVVDVQAYVSNDDQHAASAISMLQAYPNPFADETTIRYGIKTATSVKIDIYNLKGQKVKCIEADVKSTGSYSAVWNGTDEHGKLLSKGIYLCRLSTDKGVATQKLVLIK